VRIVEHAVALVPHPALPAGEIRAVTVRVRRSPDGALALAYRVEGEIAGIRIPPARNPASVRDLWKHTCLEAFVGVEGEGGYHELNFSPSGEWTLYALRSYRDGEGLDDERLAPRIAVRTDRDRLELDAAVSLHHLCAGYRDAALRLGLAAVIEAVDGSLAYWALRHPAVEPDFHHRDAFALAVEAPRGEC
jgi:hypothetical protein